MPEYPLKCTIQNTICHRNILDYGKLLHVHEAASIKILTAFCAQHISH